MCFDPWDLDLTPFAHLYHDAIVESLNPNRTEAHRRTWAGKAEFFADGFAEKLEEADRDEVENLANEWDETDEPGERVRDAIDAERKRRAEVGAAA